MDSIENYTIRDNAPIKEALQILNLVHSQAMTLFVVDEAGRMIGTLTDGDIRRALISGEELSTEVQKVAHRDFKYITNENDIKGIKSCRQKNITLIPLLDEEHSIIKVIDLTVRKSMLPIDAVLMAGGKGERLRPLTLTTPKPLLKIGNKSIIDHNVDALIENGVEYISVTVNYLKEQLIEHYSFPVSQGIKVDCVVETQFFGTIGALKLVKEFHNDTILVMNSDLLTNIDFEDFYLHFQEHDAMMSAAAIPYTISIPYGIFELDGRNIKGVSEKPVYNLYANAGIYLIKKEALKYIPENQMFNATDLISTLAANGQKVIRYPLSGLWIDIGTPEEYRKATELIKHLKK
ncbi:MAG: NTP transferase domain-containing protein [Muribaculaceae bacterium]|nr:NTP transferase domain-containing protein [Muribaculaceae bacterium]